MQRGRPSRGQLLQYCICFIKRARGHRALALALSEQASETLTAGSKRYLPSGVTQHELAAITPRAEKCDGFGRYSYIYPRTILTFGKQGSMQR